MNCAIIKWLVVLAAAVIPKCKSASINRKSLDNQETFNNNHSINITRSFAGDLFYIKDFGECTSDICTGLSSGTAIKYNTQKSVRTSQGTMENICKCQCLGHLKTYREDFQICVDDIREYSLIPFVSNSAALETSEKIPFVFLPLRGQIIYPSKELLFTEFQRSVCVVTSASYLTPNGWTEIRSSLDSGDIPFRLMRDKERTFLQWLGDATARAKMQGRLIIVKLKCQESTYTITDETTPSSIQKTPYISFRVVGSPVKTTSNITEVQFALESTDKGKENLSTNEYAVIAITSFCLGLMYIASVFLYIYYKKRKDQSSDERSVERNKNFLREDPNGFHNTRSSYQRNTTIGPPVEFMDNPEANVVKSNPLMKHFMSFNENNACFMSDSNSEAEESTRSHRDHSNASIDELDDIDGKSLSHLSAESECLPEENVTITEDSDNFDRARAMQSNVRRKLYFNPAYFEPSLLASPPPSAIDFLMKIREVITMAKGKMAAKRFQPSLNGIPEENSQSSSSETYSRGTVNSRKSSNISSRRASSKQDCSGCPGCESKKSNESPTASKNCKCCGEKQKSIQKWLENVSSANDGNDIVRDKKSLISVPIVEEDDTDITHSDDEVQETVTDDIETDNNATGFMQQDNNVFVKRDITLSARFEEQISETGSIPKIISHSLKKNIKELIYSQNFVRDKVSAFESKKNLNNNLDSNHEIYNNPKFNIEENEVEDSAKSYSNMQKKKQQAFDQYTNPIMRQSKTKTPNQMPDMIYEAIEMEKKNKPINYQLPTPDYFSHDSEYEMTKYKRTENVSFIPFVPTPDYHTYGKNTLRNLKQYQPDSPIYSRKSPAYLVVDYETDSLERLNTIKNRTALSTPTINSSDFSSQASPSALPMEEEVEIRNALYDREEGFRKDTDTIKKEREIDIQMKKTKIKYNTPNEGSMTIELEAASPIEHDAISTTDSDQFEPDTLDRQSKLNKTVIEKIKYDRIRIESEKSFQDEQLDAFEVDESEKGRLLTLETRHSKRQRGMGFASLEKLPAQIHKEKPVKFNPPDVVISSNKPFKAADKDNYAYINRAYESAPAINHIRKPLSKHDEHEYKKTQISGPIISATDIGMMPVKKTVPKTLRGEFLKMDLLNLEMDFQEKHMKAGYQPSLIKTVYHVEIPPTPSDVFENNGKKSKDLKNAWKRFMGKATSKFKKHPNDSGDSTQDEEADDQSNHSTQVITTEIKQGKVKDLIKRLDSNKLKEYDSGYLSAESINEKHLAETNDKTEHDKKSKIESVKNSSRPQVPPPPVPKTMKSFTETMLGSGSHYLNKHEHDDLVNINIYSSDEDQNSSIPESDDEANIDDNCESGTESWKFYKT